MKNKKIEETSKKKCNLVLSDSDEENIMPNDNDVDMSPEKNTPDINQKYTPLLRRKKSSKKLVSPTVSDTLDRCNISNRKACLIIGSTVKALGLQKNEVVVSEATIRRNRRKFREERADVIKSKFEPDCSLTLHWDGKLLPQLTGSEKTHRLAIMVSGGGIHQLLGIPTLDKGTGQCQANVVHEKVIEWNIKSNIGSLCFDTTAVNSGFGC